MKFILTAILAWALAQQPVGLLITVDRATVGIGETVTYTITSTEAAGVEITLAQELVITSTIPDCITQPKWGAYCVLDTAGTITITAQLAHPPCGPLLMHTIAADIYYADGPPVYATTQACTAYLPLTMQ